MNQLHVKFLYASDWVAHWQESIKLPRKLWRRQITICIMLVLETDLLTEWHLKSMQWSLTDLISVYIFWYADEFCELTRTSTRKVIWDLTTTCQRIYFKPMIKPKDVRNYGVKWIFSKLSGPSSFFLLSWITMDLLKSIYVCILILFASSLKFFFNSFQMCSHVLWNVRMCCEMFPCGMVPCVVKYTQKSRAIAMSFRNCSNYSLLSNFLVLFCMLIFKSWL